jgi:apolipoprotein N-acyltransferase
VKKMSRHKKEECFGLPRGNAIFGLFLGLIIIVWGLNELGYLKVEMWPAIVVIFGVLVVIGALFGLTRKK